MITSTVADSRFVEEGDLATGTNEFRSDVLRGLSASKKTLPCKYFYDEAGSKLFDRICTLPEYYLTRTELKILRRHGREIAALLGPGCVLVEYGSGNSLKTRILLDNMVAPAAYVPVDVACRQLHESARALARGYPRLALYPTCADFTRLEEPPRVGGRFARRAVYFPGSTIGNFIPDEARRLLALAAKVCGPGGALVLGADLKKDPRLLEAAYNDRQGVTAAFNLNLLARINRELGASFRTDHFFHRAFYNPREGRMEMYLVSRLQQRIHVSGHEFLFLEGESICTEYSYKYSLSDLHDLAEAAGFELERTWTDELDYFSVHYLTVRAED